MVIVDPTLDPVTGLPVGADYFTQYQIPLNSQPVNLTELNAQGRQNNWLYPDHIPPTLARLQARDLTNEGNAQDLSTDGRRNLNVNINAVNPSVPLGSGGGNAPVPFKHWSDSVTTDAGHITQSGFVPSPTTVWGVGWYMTPISVMPVNSNYVGECWVAFGSDGSTGLIPPFLILPPKLTYTGAALDGSGKPYVEAEVWFPSGWDCRGYLNGGNLYCYVRAQNYSLETDVHVYYT